MKNTFTIALACVAACTLLTSGAFASGGPNKIYKEQKTYMPYPGRMGRGNKMDRGPYEKSGLLRETSIPPLSRVHETFEIVYPFEDAKTGKGTRRELTQDEMTVSVVL